MLFRSVYPIQLIHSDSCAIITPPKSQAPYYPLFVDDFTRWIFVYFLNKKNGDTCTHAFNEIVAYIQTQYSLYTIQQFRCDNGQGEYDNQLFRRTLDNHRISVEPSPPCLGPVTNPGHPWIAGPLTDNPPHAKSPAMNCRGRILDSVILLIRSHTITNQSYLHYRPLTHTSQKHK